MIAPSAHGFPGLTHDGLLVFLPVEKLIPDFPHSPLIYARSSHTVPFANVHIPTCPPSDEVTRESIHHFFSQFTDAGFANPTFPPLPIFSVPLAY